MSGTGGTGERKEIEPPPGAFFFIVGVVLLALNHWSVVTGRGLLGELIVMGCALTTSGVWTLAHRQSFEAVLAWSHRSNVRGGAAGAIAVTALIALASAVAWVGYGEILPDW